MEEEIMFDGSTLTWGNQTWPAVSGPHGRGALPAGMYTVETDRRTPLTRHIGIGFRDLQTGMGYFVPLTPDETIGRTGLGIHPDGNIPGTLGCIGITSNSESFYRRLQGFGGRLRLRVTN